MPSTPSPPRNSSAFNDSDLSELVPSYVAHVPVPPLGYKLDYDANAGTVKVVKTQP